MASATTGIEIDIGISGSDRKKLADGLSRLLADTYTLYLKTHNFHWNVTGPMFQTLHLMFETHYNELALAVDLDRRAHSRARSRRSRDLQSLLASSRRFARRTECPRPPR